MAIALISTLVPLGAIAVGWLFRMQSQLSEEMASRHSEWKTSMEANTREHDALAERIREVNQTLRGMEQSLSRIDSRLSKIEARQELEAVS